MVVQELLIVVLLLRAVSLPLGIRQGLDQDGSAHCLPRGTRVWWSPVARSLCPQEVLLLPLQKSQSTFTAVITEGRSFPIADRSYGEGTRP